MPCCNCGWYIDNLPDGPRRPLCWGCTEDMRAAWEREYDLLVRGWAYADHIPRVCATCR